MPCRAECFVVSYVKVDEHLAGASAAELKVIQTCKADLAALEEESSAPGLEDRRTGRLLSFFESNYGNRLTTEKNSDYSFKTKKILDVAGLKVLNLHCLMSSNVRICILFDDPKRCRGNAVRVFPYKLFVSKHRPSKRGGDIAYTPTESDIEAMALTFPAEHHEIARGRFRVGRPDGDDTSRRTKQQKY